MIIRFAILFSFMTVLTVVMFLGPVLLTNAENGPTDTEVDQITDPGASHVLDMFRFEPDFVKLRGRGERDLQQFSWPTHGSQRQGPHS